MNSCNSDLVLITTTKVTVVLGIVVVVAMVVMVRLMSVLVEGVVINVVIEYW